MTGCVATSGYTFSSTDDGKTVFERQEEFQNAQAEKLEKDQAIADETKKREQIFEAGKTHNSFVGSVLDNILDNFDNPTYNLKLYMIPPGDGRVSTDPQTGETKQAKESDDGDSESARSTTPQAGDFNNTGSGYLNNCVRAEPENTVVLAQTGVTEVGIDNLEITTATGPNSSATSTVNFTITQPNAADFPDQIVKGRQLLGAPPDAGDCPLFLEINFLGYYESDAERTLKGRDRPSEKFDVEKGGTPVNILGPIIYPLYLKNFTMNVTAGGSVYNFETVVQNELGYADNFFRLQKNITIKGNTISGMLNDLQSQINSYNKKKDGNEDSNPDPLYTLVFGMPDGGTLSENKKIDGLDIEDQTLDIAEAEKVARIIGPEHDGKRYQSQQAVSKKLAEENQKNDDFNKRLGLTPSSPLYRETDLDVIGLYQQEYSIFDSTFSPQEFIDSTVKVKTDYSPSIKKNKVEVNPDAQDKITIDLDAGMTLSDALGIILSMNKEFMQKCTRTKDIQDPTNKDVDATKQVMWYTFDTSIRYVKDGWDDKAKQYKKIAVYVPRTFVSDKSDIAVFPWEIEKTNNLTKQETSTRLQQMSVRKAYEYIFTGRNDQIKNVDIQYNEGLALLLPPERGTLGDISLNAASILKSDPVPKNEELEDGGLEKLAKSKSKGGFFDQLKDLIKQGNDIVENIGRAANFSNEDIRDLVNNAQGKAAQKLQGILSDQSNAQAVADQLTKNRKTSAQGGSQTETDEFVPAQSGFVYGGDLIGTNKYTEEIAENVNQSHNLPLRGNHQNKDGISNVGTFKGIKNNLFTYLYSQNQAVDFLMKLEMTVRGDPWWLGREPQAPGDNKQIPGQSADKTASSPGDDLVCAPTDRVNYLLFSLNSPRLFDPNVENEDKNTGLWMKEGDGTSYFMSGIYQVRTVVHRFNNGVYDCDIDAAKEIAIDLSNVDRVSGDFVLTDTDRKSFSNRAQDGALTETEIEQNEFIKDHVYYVKGAIDGARGQDWVAQDIPKGLSGFNKEDWIARQLLERGTISRDEYRSWHTNKKLQEEKRDSKKTG